MNISKSFKTVVFTLLTVAGASVAHAQQATITISTGGNVNSSAVFEAWCVNSGKSCKVTGNRTHHAGPRSCSMSCNIDDIAVFSCSANNNNRWIDEMSVPSGATLIDADSNREAYGWAVSTTTSVGCSITD